MHQVRALLQQAPAFDQRLADQSELGMFQVAQAAVNDARGTTGRAGCKVVLFDQQACGVQRGRTPARWQRR